jgi:hypothetical protein
LDAGTVGFFTPPPFDPCAGSVDQANLLPRTPESSDRLGTALALGRRSDNNAAERDRAFIGVPGEDNAAGIVQSTPMSSESNSTDVVIAGVGNPSVGHSGGDLAGANYGAVIASPAGE